MLVDIKCLSIDPLFYANPTPNDPFFLFSPHPTTPFFFHFCITSYIKIANFCPLRAHFEKLNDFCGNFNRKFANFALKLHFCTLNDPHFGEFTPKKPPFFWCPHRMTPFFRRNLTPNASYFRSPVGTCTSLSYLSAPPDWPLLYSLAKHARFCEPDIGIKFKTSNWTEIQFTRLHFAQKFSSLRSQTWLWSVTFTSPSVRSSDRIGLHIPKWKLSAPPRLTFH